MSSPALPHLVRPPRASSLRLLLAASGYGLPGGLVSATLSGLPVELQVEILSCFYSDIYALLRIRLVCKRFRSIIRALSVNWRIEQGTKARKARDRMAGKFAQMFPNMFSMQLHGCQALTNGLFAHLQTLRNLQHLDLSNNPLITGEGLEWLAATPLRALFLENCPAVNNDGLLAIGHLRSLELLQLQGCAQLSDKGLRPLLQLPRLSWLSLRHCAGLSDQSMRTVSQLTSLRVLTLPSRMSDRGLRQLAPLTQLTGLFVAHAAAREKGLLAGVAPLPPLQLVELCIFGCARLTDAALRSLTQRFSRLMLLNVGACPLLTGPGVATALHVASELRVLHLDGNERAVDDELLHQLVGALPQLRKLNVKHCARLSDRGVQALAQLPALESVALRGCPLVSAAALLALRHAVLPRVLDVRL